MVCSIFKGHQLKIDSKLKLYIFLAPYLQSVPCFTVSSEFLFEQGFIN